MVNSAKYLAFDYETGGIPHDRSPLTVYFAVLDKDLNVIEELEMAMKPNGNEPYIIDAGALAVNKINLVEHDKTAITVSEAGGKLRDLIKRHVPYGAERLTPLGHGIHFDLDFTYQHLLNKHEFQKFVSYRAMDTGIIARFLSDCGMLPGHVQGSLTAMMDYFGIPWEGEAHNCKSDTKGTIEVFRSLRQLIQRLQFSARHED